MFSRDGRYAYVFGRDGGLTKVDLLTQAIVKRVIQAGNSIGGAISADGRVVAAQNYEPGGVKLFESVLAPEGLTSFGLAWFPAWPPVQELDFEADVRRVRTELVI